MWDTPCSLAALWLAFLVNLTAFPLTSGLLPYVAREIYHIDQTGLGTLVASFAVGSLLGSIAVSLAGRAIRPARMMIVFALAWYAMLLVFVRMPTAGERPRRADARRLRAEPQPGADVGDAAAQRRRALSRPGHGRAHAGDLRLPIGLLAAGALIDRIGFRADGVALLPPRGCADRPDRAALAGRSVAARCAGQRAVSDGRRYFRAASRNAARKPRTRAALTPKSPRP